MFYLNIKNILLNENNTAVITDFGLSGLIDFNKTIFNYTYLVQTIWYRSPEIYFKIPYNEAIDMWSFGIIFYELLFDKILIKCNIDENLLLNIINILDIPNNEYIVSHYNITKYFYHNISTNKWDLYTYNDSKNNKIIPGYNKKFENIITDKFDIHIASKFIELIKSCLIYDMNKRITPKKALQYIDENILHLITS